MISRSPTPMPGGCTRSAPSAVSIAPCFKLQDGNLVIMDQQEISIEAGGTVAAPAPTEKLEAPATGTASSNASSTPRPHYVPQFSAATQMILQRIGKPGSFSSAISSSSALSRDIEPSAFQDAKRRLVMNLNTSLTMPMPAPSRSQQATAAILPMNDAFQLRTPSLGKPAVVTSSSAKTLPLPTKQIAGKPSPAKPTPARTASKRKRSKAEDEVESPTSSNFSQDGPLKAARVPEPPSPATITKSGRQILKPTTYNPNTVAAAQAAAIQQNSSKRKHWGKRTAEQALCKVCTRGLSPLKNQVVFCDGCNLCWHQLCHEPYIDDAFVSDEAKSWFCNKCMAKRERHLARKKTIDGFKGVSWSAKSADQRRTYLASLPPAQLVNLVMYSLELHPDLPIFPANETAKRSTSGAASTTTAIPHNNTKGTPTEMSPRAPIHYSRKFSTPIQTTKAAKSNTPAEQAAREESEDSVPPAWPKSGQGILSHMNLDEDDFQDKNDFEAFSLTTYDDRGRKVIENGLSV